MTVQEAKDNLPDVKVMLSDGRIVKGVIGSEYGNYAVIHTGYGRFECSWSTIAGCVTTDKPIRY